jgi:hypothetical protein
MRVRSPAPTPLHAAVGDQISGRESNPALIEGNRMRGSTPGASSQEQIPDPGDEAALTAAISITEPLLPPLEQTQRYVAATPLRRQ